MLTLKTVALSFLILILLLAGASFGFFGDELDNLLGGKIIASGGALYVDYWSHHMPLVYQISAGMYAAGARSYLDFRLMWAVLMWSCGVVLHVYLRQPVVLWMLLALAVCAPTLHTNMILAESLVGYLALAAWLILPSSRKSAPLILMTLAWAITTASLKHIYLSIWIALLTCWQFRHSPRWIAAGMVLPAGLSLLYLLISRNSAELIEQAYMFNRDFYAPYAVYAGEPIPRGVLDTLAVMALDYARAQITLITRLSTPFAALSGFALALLGHRIYRHHWFDALALAGLLVLSYPVNEPFYNSGTHFIGHYTVLVGISAYAVIQLYTPHGHAAVSGVPAACAAPARGTR